MSRIPQENLSIEALKAERTRPAKPGAKAKPERSLRAVFRAKLAEIRKNLEALKKPWMSKKSFGLITTEEQLVAYVDNILTDQSLWQQPYYNKPERMPVVAVDTETHGLDTRVMVDFELKWDPALGREVCLPIFELNIEIAGICLSADGIKGVYLPLFHEDGQNVPIEVAQRELQRLFDASHLVFYNAKFDREVLRQTVGLRFRDYPFYEDIQVLHFSNDPKAELDGDEFAGGGGDGLKGLSHRLLGIDQIELSAIGKVKAKAELSAEEIEEIRLRPTWVKLTKKQVWYCAPCKYVQSAPVHAACGGKITKAGCKPCKDAAPVLGCEQCRVPVTPIVCEGCGDPAVQMRVQVVGAEDGTETTERRFECAKPSCNTKVSYKAAGLKMLHVPFSWIPTDIALWYAAADGICTWLLWAYKPRKAAPEDPEPDCLHVEAQRRSVVHATDGRLIDTLTWMERQRLLIDTERHARLVKWSARATQERRQKLREIANRHGWEEMSDDDGVVFPDTVFNVDSPHDLPKLLFDLKHFIPTKLTETGKRSCDASALEDLMKMHPHDEFLLALKDYKEYVALHPEKLSWDRRDKTARIYLKQNTVAGGRLAASGGKFDRDGGVNMNIQAIKSVGGNWWVKGDVLQPDLIEEDDVEPREESELDPSCFLEAKKDEIVADGGVILEPSDPRYPISAGKQGFALRKGKWTKKAPGIIKNHIANYLGYAVCLVPGCKSCADKFGVLIPKTKMDANQIINLRSLFIAPKGWTLLSSDYSNIEVRGAANISGEKELQNIFILGDGDHHALTASKVFPEFNDPATSKARRKELRSLAKIINFALQYGGTEFTIYENLKAVIPDITMERTREMVDAYWKGVPQFERWCKEKQRIAREQMICTTVSGRIIKFQSAMDAMGIRVPLPEEVDLYYQYLRIRKQYRVAEQEFKDTGAEEAKVRADAFKLHMDRLWRDPDTGVRNAIDHNKFMSKIQRVAVNAPVQGIAGDFMRMALNRLRLWATGPIDRLVQSVLRLHNSVHDEVDYAVKNQYLPFVVPRITRLMKLRKLHERMGWPVPIECDTEYGQSWDVKYHLTGDDGHKPSAWTDCAGMEEYLPEGFTLIAVNKLVSAIASGDAARHEKARIWLEGLLHPRAYLAAKHALYADGKSSRIYDEAVIRKQLIAAIQLHEYWTIDNIPDGAEADMETFAQFEARCGLTEGDRGFMPEEGWLFSVPLDRVKRMQVPVLGDEPEPGPEPGDDNLLAEDAEVDTESDADDADTVPEQTTPSAVAEAVCEELVQLEERVQEKVEQVIHALDVAKAVIELKVPAFEEDDMFLPPPRKKEVTPVAPEPVPVIEARPDPFEGLPRLRDKLPTSEFKALMKYLNPMMGSHTVRFVLGDKIEQLRNCFRADIPAQYLAEAQHG